MRHPDDPHRTILVADDSIEMLTLYGIIIERMGYTTLKAGSLDEVYQLLDETEALDLILLGTYLDGQMYTDTAARLRQRPAAAHDAVEVVDHVGMKEPFWDGMRRSANGDWQRASGKGPGERRKSRL
jgi:CheY-like chemotaxis protein